MIWRPFGHYLEASNCRARLEMALLSLQDTALVCDVYTTSAKGKPPITPTFSSRQLLVPNNITSSIVHAPYEAGLSFRNLPRYS